MNADMVGRRAGVKHVIFPKANERDYAELPEILREVASLTSVQPNLVPPSQNPIGYGHFRCKAPESPDSTWKPRSGRV